jgi:hypothetical protein
MSSVATGLHAAMLLARGKPEGLLYLDTDMDGAARSFRAALICLPAFAALRLLDWAELGPPDDVTRTVLLELLSYAIGWAGYAIASRYVATALGRAARWPRFIAAWNWCNVAQYALLLAAQVPLLLDAPAWMAQVVWIVAVCWAIWLQWFAARLTLDVPRLQAAGMVALDLGIGFLLTGLSGV